MVNNNMDPLEWLRTQLGGDDLLREMVREFPQRLMAVNHRNGYRVRPFMPDGQRRAGLWRYEFGCTPT